MKWYAAIDLHSSNNVTVVIDEQDRVVYQKRLANELAVILTELSVYEAELQGIAVESTYNWYWLGACPTLGIAKNPTHTFGSGSTIAT